MPKLNFDVPNPIGQEKAVSLVQKFIPLVEARFKDMVKDVQQNLNGNKLDFSFKSMGMTIQGVLTIDPEKVNVAMELPFAAMMMKGKIQSEVTTALEKLLGRESPST